MGPRQIGPNIRRSSEVSQVVTLRTKPHALSYGRDGGRLGYGEDHPESRLGSSCIHPGDSSPTAPQHTVSPATVLGAANYFSISATERNGAPASAFLVGQFSSGGPPGRFSAACWSAPALDGFISVLCLVLRPRTRIPGSPSPWDRGRSCRQTATWGNTCRRR